MFNSPNNKVSRFPWDGAIRLSLEISDLCERPRVAFNCVRKHLNQNKNGLFTAHNMFHQQNYLKSVGLCEQNCLFIWPIGRYHTTGAPQLMIYHFDLFIQDHMTYFSFTQWKLDCICLLVLSSKYNQYTSHGWHKQTHFFSDFSNMKL